MPPHDEDTTIRAAAQRGRLSPIGPMPSGGMHDPAMVAADLAEILTAQLSADVVVHLRDELLAPGSAGQETQHHVIFRKVASCRGRPPNSAGWVYRPGKLVRLAAGGSVLLALARDHHLYVDHVDPFTADHLAGELGEPRIERDLIGRDLLVIPITANGYLLGYVQVVGGRHQAGRSAQEISAARSLVRSAARLIGRALGHAHPPGGILLPGVEVHRRHRPAGGAGTGGDWCDALPLPGGRVALVIGDVMGHGVRAAEVMNRCAILTGALTAFSLRPDLVLRELDRLADLIGEDYLATCACLVFDPADRTCRLANAGHLPPILIEPGHNAVSLEIPANTPIGLGRLEFEIREFDVPDGSLLALCTDGLVERRDRDVNEGLEELRASLDRPGQALSDACDAAFARLMPEQRDDATLLLARFLGPEPRPNVER